MKAKIFGIEQYLETLSADDIITFCWCYYFLYFCECVTIFSFLLVLKVFRILYVFFVYYFCLLVLLFLDFVRAMMDKYKLCTICDNFDAPTETCHYVGFCPLSSVSYYIHSVSMKLILAKYLLSLITEE